MYLTTIRDDGDTLAFRNRDKSNVVSLALLAPLLVLSIFVAVWCVTSGETSSSVVLVVEWLLIAAFAGAGVALAFVSPYDETITLNRASRELTIVRKRWPGTRTEKLGFAQVRSERGARLPPAPCD